MKKISLVLAIAFGAVFFAWSQTNCVQAKTSPLDGTWELPVSLYGPSPPQTMSGKTISGFSATGLIRRSDFTFRSSKFNTVIGDDVKFTIDVEIEKQ